MANGNYSTLLQDLGFQSYLWTQFLSAFNDNVYKIVLSLLAVDLAARTGAGGAWLSLAGAVFILPFLLFSGYAGRLADSCNKRRVILWTKAWEIVLMMGGVAALASGRME